MRADKVVHRARTRVVALPLLVLVGGFAALPVSAAVYTVTMKNGSTFDTRYQPEEASWDENMVVLMTEFGNRIALPTSEIDSVSVDSESRGFGLQINSTTMALGWAPNDAIDPSTPEGQAAMAAATAAAANAAQASPVYNQQQFVEPGALTGLPVWMTGVNAVPQVEPTQSAPPRPNS